MRCAFRTVVALGLALAGCGGSASTQPPPGSAPGCEEEGEAYDARRCESQGSQPVREDLSGGVPEGSAPGLAEECDDEVEGRRCPEQGSQPMRPNLGGPIPEGNAPGLDEPADDED